MKHKKLFLFIAAVILVTLAVCIHPGKLLQPRQEEPAEPRTAAAPVTYEGAAALISDSYQLQISSEKIIEAEGQTFHSSAAQVLNCSNLNSPDAVVQLREDVDCGAHSFSIREQYKNGTALSDLENGRFSSVITLDDYLSRQIPAMIMDPSLYGSVQYSQSGTKTMVGFSEPSAPEHWAAPEEAVLEQASGSVLLSEDGSLESCSYSAVYTHGSARVTLIVKTRLLPAEDSLFPEPDASVPCTDIDSLQIPRLLEYATGYLMQAESVQSQTEESIVCQAGNLQRVQKTDLSLQNTEENLTADIQMDVELTDYNQGGTSRTICQHEQYRDGSYTMTSDGQDSVTKDDTEITPEMMRLYAQNILVGTVILPEHVTSAYITETENSYLITFGGSEELAEIICSDACETLYQDPELMNDYVTSYKTEHIICSLEISRETGLPMSSGLRYQGIHSIEDTSYLLKSEMNQTYRFEA